MKMEICRNPVEVSIQKDCQSHRSLATIELKSLVDETAKGPPLAKKLSTDSSSDEECNSRLQDSECAEVLLIDD